MDGRIIPDGLGAMEPWYLNAFENVLTVQFDHRMLGYLIALLAALNIWLAWSAGGQHKRLAVLSGALVVAQITLGVYTLLTQLQIGLALAHQAGALILFAFALFQLHKLRAIPGKA